MAITKTIFTGATVADNASEVLTWLQANGTTYFDSITFDNETSTIICEKADEAALVLGFASGQKCIQIYARNGATASGGASNIKFAYGVTTSTAIYLVTADTKANSVVITKNANNQLFMIAKLTPATGSNPTHLYIVDFYNSTTATDIPYIFTSNYTTFDTSIAYGSALTSLTPIPALDYPSYAPNVYFEFFNEYNGISGKIIIGDTEYFSNGYLALKG
jgi:hypothetical protein